MYVLCYISMSCMSGFVKEILGSSQSVLLGFSKFDSKNAGNFILKGAFPTVIFASLIFWYPFSNAY